MSVPPSITFISAGAGSGKTTRLTGILHEALASGQADPDGILATTFTTKAAAELKERVRAMFVEKGEHSLATAVGEAMIGTVNSVCGALLRRFAFELGLTVEQKVLDEKGAALEIARAVDRAVTVEELRQITLLSGRLGVVDRKTGDTAWKEHVKGIIDQARYNNIGEGLFGGFAASSADELLAHFPPPDTGDPDGELLDAIRRVRPVVLEALAVKERKNTKGWFDDLLRLESLLKNGGAGWSDWVKLSKASPQASLREAAKAVSDRCSRVAAHPRLHTDIRAYLGLVFGIAGRTLGVYQQMKHEAGLVDFADQEARLLEGLDHPGVREQLAEKLDLLLVDEFQDTSPIQLALFLKLSRLAKRTWWVGDVKQAIYGFRGSDTRLMRSVLDLLSGESRETLGSSWRSVPALVEGVNAIFTPAFSPAIKPADVVLHAEREDEEGRVPYLHWVLDGSRAQEHYAALGSGIRRLLREGYRICDRQEGLWRPVRPGDIAVLARTNAHVRGIASELSRQGILVATVQPGLLATPEAVLVLASLRRLLDPADTLATAEIVSLADAREPESWLQDRLDYLASGADEKLWLEEGGDRHPLIGAIADLRRQAAQFSPAEALQRVVTVIHAAGHAVSWCSSAEAARSRLLNLQALVQLARDYEEECLASSDSLSVAGLLSWLNSLAREELDAFPEPQIDAVRIMTHHKAKGLEWPVTVLLGLDAEPGVPIWSPCAFSRSGFSASDPLRDRFIRFWPWPFGAQKQAPGIDALMEGDVMREARELAREEAVRLLYVSMTRARDCLVLATSSRNTQVPWLAAAGAESLVTGDGDQVGLAEGILLARRRWELPGEPESGTETGAVQQLFWFSGAASPSVKLRETVSPSSLGEVGSGVVRTECYGGALDVLERERPSEFGTALHGVLAFALLQEERFTTPRRVIRMLDAWQMGGAVDASAFCRQVSCFRKWMGERWPGASVRAEYPVQRLLDGGQVLNGSIDLLLDTGTGWVVIDHKSPVQPPESWEEAARAYSGQLLAYRDALLAGTGRPVESCWIHFVTGGIAVGLGFQ
jgi:ATP-dependent exoDNAse (exonuclease V) beta subunit